MGNWLATDVQLEAEARIRKLKKELKLEKDIRLPTTLLASDGLMELKSKTALACSFAKRRAKAATT